MNLLPDNVVEREARRVFRSLSLSGTHFSAAHDGSYRLLRTGVESELGARTAKETVDAFVRRGWLKQGAGKGTYVLSDAGQGWYARATASDDPFAAQHRMLRKTFIREDGREIEVTVNDAESVLSRLKARQLIDPAQYEAGERLARDFTLGCLMPRMAPDLTMPIGRGSRGGPKGLTLSDTVIAARQRFAQAMAAAGPGLSDILFDVCCYASGLAAIEQTQGWPPRAGRVVLKLALDRLVDYYGLTITATASPIRSWTAEAALANADAPPGAEAAEAS